MFPGRRVAQRRLADVWHSMHSARFILKEWEEALQDVEHRGFDIHEGEREVMDRQGKHSVIHQVPEGFFVEAFRP